MALPRHSKHCYIKPGDMTGLFLWRLKNGFVRCVRVEISVADRFQNKKSATERTAAATYNAEPFSQD